MVLLHKITSDRKITYELLVIRDCPLSHTFFCASHLSLPSAQCYSVHSLLQKSSLVTPLLNAEGIVPLFGHHIQACVVGLVTVVQHFIAPTLTSVTLWWCNSLKLGQGDGKQRPAISQSVHEPIN